MIGIDFSLEKNKELDAFMEVVTFELRCEGALKMQEREEKDMSPRLQHE